MYTDSFANFVQVSLLPGTASRVKGTAHGPLDLIFFFFSFFSFGVNQVLHNVSISGGMSEKFKFKKFFLKKITLYSSVLYKISKKRACSEHNSLLPFLEHITQSILSLN